MSAHLSSSLGTPTPTHSRLDPHARVSALILAQLKTADPASWSPPWHGVDPLPRNALTGRRYRGINILVLWAAAQANGYADARWATYRQWATLGAQVRRGERGTAVLFYKDLTADGADTTAAAADDALHFVARTSAVFNAAQVDGAPDLAASLPSPELTEPLSILAAFVAATGARIIEGGTRACYMPASDSIHLPPQAAFHSAEGYAGTLAHELIHWAGAPHRLHRDLTGRFGSQAYAAEELVAELGAAFVLADLGLARSPHPDHAKYVAHWLPLLRADPRAFTTAASHASRAAAYLAGLHEAGGVAIGAEVPALSSEQDGAGADAIPFIKVAA
ncbi:zincin-like metallopeptidase domain-containing protein [Methylobacterium sp. J-030]|uniref:ArdC family protein n=1 Tax=Methylobacterium sp. J-030 TaxID=2836627 RepID=UPI001FB8D25A|nr:zincin-like metallopeptidase domain-containing protein [Methylobacterium sp. J-030]MCJ2073379.1 zincin-like metallopeptidase domain-containing protein [Methylobacterium sp. J-030]